MDQGFVAVNALRKRPVRPALKEPKQAALLLHRGTQGQRLLAPHAIKRRVSGLCRPELLGWPSRQVARLLKTDLRRSTADGERRLTAKPVDHTDAALTTAALSKRTFVAA